MNVITNSTRPSSISADVCRPGAASANSLASADVIELPDENSDTSFSMLVLPITNVTAIVSPSARPRPSMMPPTTPARVYGSTIFQTTSQVVPPSPYDRLLQQRRRDLEDVAHHRRDERNDHDREDDAGAQQADADRRARNSLPISGTLPIVAPSGVSM